MKFTFFIFLLLTLAGFSYENPYMSPPINIEWVENLDGDFSFKEQWGYPEGVYRNRHGQLSCDGICPTAIDNMKDEEGKIYPDSLTVFYELVDTTHIFHSLKSENRMYEYSGTDFIEFKRLADGTIRGESFTNVSTHSSLIIDISGDSCSAWVIYNSIRGDVGKHIFPLSQGKIRVDPLFFKKGIFKATFNFQFNNTLDPQVALFWKGSIYSRINVQ